MCRCSTGPTRASRSTAARCSACSITPRRVPARATAGICSGGSPRCWAEFPKLCVKHGITPETSHKWTPTGIPVRLRGVGKTVLLRRIADIARETGYRVVFIEAPEGKRLPDLLVPKLRQVLLDLDRLGAVSAAVKRALRVFKSFTSAVKLSYDGVDLGLSIAPETGVADTGQLEIDLPDLLTAVGSAAKSRDVPI